MFKRIKRDFLIILWTLVFFFGAAMLLGVALFIIKEKNPNFADSQLIHTFSILNCLIIAPVGLALGIFGFLPGTKK
jgi:NADH:ubiquinone oxidoreductase subunit 6 (subunit J)